MPRVPTPEGLLRKSRTSKDAELARLMNGFYDTVFLMPASPLLERRAEAIRLCRGYLLTVALYDYEDWESSHARVVDHRLRESGIAAECGAEHLRRLMGGSSVPHNRYIATWMDRWESKGTRTPPYRMSICKEGLAGRQEEPEKLISDASHEGAFEECARHLHARSVQFAAESRRLFFEGLKRRSNLWHHMAVHYFHNAGLVRMLTIEGFERRMRHNGPVADWLARSNDPGVLPDFDSAPATNH